MAGSYTPPYTITDDIINLISVISNLLGKLTAEGTLAKKPHLRKANRIQSIHSSLAIENNTLTLSQVTDIINGKAVLGPYNEILEVKNAGRAYDLLETFNPYSEADLLKAHEVLMTGLTKEAGMFRSCGVGVFSGETCIHLAPPAQFVSGHIHDLLQWAKETTVHPLIKSSVFHFELEFIHPFTDGNGRIGRLWQTLILSEWDKAFIWIPVETLILGRQEAYYEALAQAGKTGDSTVFIEFMLEMLRQALVTPQNEMLPDTINDTLNDTLNDTEQLILKLIEENPKITIQELMEKTGKSRPTIIRGIDVLKESGFLIREGAKKNGRWKVQYTLSHASQ